jgi:hypothetical protein
MTGREAVGVDAAVIAFRTLRKKADADASLPISQINCHHGYDKSSFDYARADTT